MIRFSWLISVFVVLACNQRHKHQVTESNPPKIIDDTMMIANLDDTTRLSPIFQTFKKNNPGYDLNYIRQTTYVKSSPLPRIAFLQNGGGTATLTSDEVSKISVGDIIVLSPNSEMSIDSAVDLLIFTTPDQPSDSIPTFIRPDWDPNITDIPGGCATETNAYRRILLTWLGKVGKYLYQSLNAHRVRIMDSFTHYHPKEGGFDEFYLVQMAMPGASLITGNRADLVEDPDQLTPNIIKDLFKTTPLKVGDLIYLPRGVIHRGIGGVLAQVITIPGFVPMAEIGVDHHIKKINQKFDLTGSDSLAYNLAAGDKAVIK